MANARGKEVDTTSLSLTHAVERGWIHRDYLSHVFRWNHVVKRVRSGFKNLHILDVGCGVEAPLPFTLFSNQLNHKGGTGSYTGVDYGNIKPHQYLLNAMERGTFNATFLDHFDFAKDALPHVGEGYHAVVCFEVLEHVEPLHAFKLLRRINKVLRPIDGYAYLSTPVYDQHVGAADNHVNEMSRLALAALMKLAGLRFTDCYGTFASQKDYKQHLPPHDRQLFEKLSDYYDPNVLACFFAPLYPQYARNCLWEVVSNGVNGAPINDSLMEKLIADAHLHSSSKKWAKHIKMIQDHVTGGAHGK